MSGFGFKDKRMAEKLRDGAFRLQPQNEQIIYPEPGEIIRLWHFELVNALSKTPNASATANMVPIANTTVTSEHPPVQGVVTDVPGYYGPLPAGTTGIAYYQLGIFQVIEVECPENQS